MKTIALLGAPGSGKTQLAKAIKSRMEIDEPPCDQCPAPVLVADQYALKTRDDGEYEIGLNGGYMANIDIAMERYRMERRIGHIEPKLMVTCGTVIETAVYSAMHFERSLTLKNTDEEKMEEAKRFQGCTSMLAVMFMDMFKYERAFYLPSPVKPEDDRWLNFERNLQAAFQAYQAPVIPLVVEDFNDKEDLTEKRLARLFE